VSTTITVTTTSFGEPWRAHLAERLVALRPGAEISVARGTEDDVYVWTDALGWSASSDEVGGVNLDEVEAFVDGTPRCDSFALAALAAEDLAKRVRAECAAILREGRRAARGPGIFARLHHFVRAFAAMSRSYQYPKECSSRDRIYSTGSSRLPPRRGLGARRCPRRLSRHRDSVAALAQAAPRRVRGIIVNDSRKYNVECEGAHWIVDADSAKDAIQTSVDILTRMQDGELDRFEHWLDADSTFPRLGEPSPNPPATYFTSERVCQKPPCRCIDDHGDSCADDAASRCVNILASIGEA